VSAEKNIQICIGVDVDAVASWLGSYGGQDSPNDIQRGMFYGVRAQMLAPLPSRGPLTGWVSVHSVAERAWTPAEQLVASQAAATVAAALDGSGQ
jgi:GAF domain-containing protein